MTKCCMECFSDRVIRQKIARKSKIEGGCERCATPRAALLPCSDLTSEFSLLLSLYEPAEDGEALSVLIERDWEVFSNQVADKAGLLEELLPGTAQHKYGSVQLPPDGVEGRWTQLKEELKKENRFFPRSAPDRDELSQLLGLLVISQDVVPRSLFRARIQRDDGPFDIEGLKAPPLGRAQGGRANPPGLSYLYVASDARTAVLEVRPTVADAVATCRFEPTKPFKLIDLTHPRKLISPFGGDFFALGSVRLSTGLLEILSEDLTRPTPPHRAATDYIATQYLCELIKVLGYDGVRYRSSLNPGGMNFAFFDVETLRPVDTFEVVTVSSVALEYN